VRIVPLKDVLSSLPYLVREIARNENKKVDIIIKDHNISLDKAIVDEIVEILIQLLKNAVAHGIADKQAKGKIIVDFSLVGDRMYVSVEDNGQGINWQNILALAIKNKIVSSQKAKTMTIEQIKNLIFQAGISKGRHLNTISGRGIGLSLVKAKTEELGGSIEVISKTNKGTKFIIDLPQPLSVFRSIIFNLLGYVFALPLDYIDKIINLDTVKNLNKVKTFTYKPARQASGKAGGKSKYKLINLLNIFDIKNFEPLYKYMALINYKGSKIALPIIRQIEEDELIMKRTPLILKNNKHIKGVAISAQGQAILVLDINNLI